VRDITANKKCQSGSIFHDVELKICDFSQVPFIGFLFKYILKIRE
jgi:hypothetical protein